MHQSASPTASSAAVGQNSGAVDLTFTGTISLTARGNAGRCELGQASDGTVSAFGFTATGADYQGLGYSFNLAEDIASHKLSVKWLLGAANIHWVGDVENGVTISPDDRAVMLDADLPGDARYPEHVKGTITCAA